MDHQLLDRAVTLHAQLRIRLPQLPPSHDRSLAACLPFHSKGGRSTRAAFCVTGECDGDHM